MQFEEIPRRGFLKSAITLAVALRNQRSISETFADPDYKHLPRWRGFNLLEKFDGNRNQPFKESDFQMIHDLGFDFVRLPLSYRCWSSPDDWYQLNESVLKEIDQAIEYGHKYHIHVNLNMHRIPGYCVNPPEEPLNLWKDKKALDAAAFHWSKFAERYKGISNNRVSFDLINEPSNVNEADYVNVVSTISNAIREKDPKRLIIIDGLQYGTIPVVSAVDIKLAQSTRGYGPFQLTHYKASWAKGSDTWPVPAWPYPTNNGEWNKERLIKETYTPWKQLADRNIGVHVGEWGAYNFTPHEVVLSWMKDLLSIWKQYGWGWSLWNFRGPFGILDSNRSDVVYEDYKGHKLDRKMLELLQNN